MPRCCGYGPSQLARVRLAIEPQVDGSCAMRLQQSMQGGHDEFGRDEVARAVGKPAATRARAARASLALAFDLDRELGQQHELRLGVRCCMCKSEHEHEHANSQKARRK